MGVRVDMGVERLRQIARLIAIEVTARMGSDNAYRQLRLLKLAENLTEETLDTFARTAGFCSWKRAREWVGEWA